MIFLEMVLYYDLPVNKDDYQLILKILSIKKEAELSQMLAKQRICCNEEEVVK